MTDRKRLFRLIEILAALLQEHGVVVWNVGDGSRAFTYAVPIYGENGKVLDVEDIDISLDELAERILGEGL
jgi:hypothetical protein